LNQSFYIALALWGLTAFADILTGYLLAWRTKRVSSSIGREGLCKKLYLAVLISVIEGFHLYFGTLGVKTPPIGEFACFIAACFEFFSIIENGKELNVQAVPMIGRMVTPLIERLALTYVAGNKAVKFVRPEVPLPEAPDGTQLQEPRPEPTEPAA
jgi:phage-related holin